MPTRRESSYLRRATPSRTLMRQTGMRQMEGWPRNVLRRLRHALSLQRRRVRRKSASRWTSPTMSVHWNLRPSRSHVLLQCPRRILATLNRALWMRRRIRASRRRRCRDGYLHGRPRNGTALRYARQIRRDRMCRRAPRCNRRENMRCRSHLVRRNIRRRGDHHNSRENFRRGIHHRHHRNRRLRGSRRRTRRRESLRLRSHHRHGNRRHRHRGHLHRAGQVRDSGPAQAHQETKQKTQLSKRWTGSSLNLHQRQPVGRLARPDSWILILLIAISQFALSQFSDGCADSVVQSNRLLTRQRLLINEDGCHRIEVLVVEQVGEHLEARRDILNCKCSREIFVKGI